MADSEIHVGSGRRKFDKKLLLKRLLIGTGLVVLVAAVAGGAGAGLRWWQVKQDQKRAAQPQAVSKEATEAQNLALEGDFDKAHDTVNEALKNPSLSAQAKHDLYLQQGVTYENETKNAEALESYRKAFSIKETMDAAQAIARMFEAAGDKQQAIIYYGKAIPLVPQDDAMRDAFKKYFENKIIVLEGGQPNYE